MSSIEGSWLSRYEYGQGENDAPHSSEHRIVFRQEGDIWVGRSMPAADGSEITLTLKQQGAAFTGEWAERTSPSGHYGGRGFSGLLMLVLEETGDRLTGKWLGASSATHQVKAGLWTLVRPAEE